MWPFTSRNSRSDEEYRRLVLTEAAARAVLPLAPQGSTGHDDLEKVITSASARRATIEQEQRTRGDTGQWAGRTSHLLGQTPVPELQAAVDAALRHAVGKSLSTMGREEFTAVFEQFFLLYIRAQDELKGRDGTSQGAPPPAPAPAGREAADDARVRFRCGGCGRRLHAPARHAGKRVKCPTCAAVVDVPPPTLSDAPAAAPADSTPVPAGEEQAMAMRAGILSRHPLTARCEYNGDVMPKMPGLIRVVLYRLDGNALQQDQIKQALMSLVLLRQNDPTFRDVHRHFSEHFGFGCPYVGYSIGLPGNGSQANAMCDVLANTDFLELDTHHRVTGHSLSADGVRYRMYLYWSS